MAANENSVKKSGLSYRQTVVVAVVSAVLSGSGVPWFLSALGVNPFRPDPFTRSDGLVLERRIEKLEGHVDRHPDVELRAAIADLRAEASAAKSERLLIIKNQDRMMQRLDRMQ